MITFTGIPVYPGNDRSPSLADIAVSLGRHPRFGGHTRMWWSVLHHSIVCGKVAEASNLGNPTKLYALLHDAHECVIGDIPSTWNTPEISETKKGLDVRIYGLFKLHRDRNMRREIIRIDRMALLAEALHLGPPGIMAYFEEDVNKDVYAIVRETETMYHGPMSSDGIESRAVQDYMKMVEECQI